MSAHLSEAIHALHAVPINPTTEGCPICPDYLALVAAAVAAERSAWVGKINGVMQVRIRPGGSMRAATLGEVHAGLLALIAGGAR